MAENVYLFIPNLIGYVRIIAGLAAFYYAEDWSAFLVLYFISYFLDCIDGFAARYFGQATRFGQMLDMVTDRACTACLLGLLAHLYAGTALAFGFYILLALDLCSHYCHVYSQLLSGSESHKKLADTENWLLKIYYHNQKVLFILCFFNETAFVMAFLLAHAYSNSPTAPTFILEPARTMLYLCLPFASVKQYLNVLQMLSATRRIVAHDVFQRRVAAKMK